jgi:uncharacterized protein (TIGR00251 family)
VTTAARPGRVGAPGAPGHPARDERGAHLRVRVTPRASRNAIEGVRDGVLRVRVTAPPVEGEANRAVAALVAEALGLRASAVTVVQGLRGRDKVVRIDGMTASAAGARLRGTGGEAMVRGLVIALAVAASLAAPALGRAASEPAVAPPPAADAGLDLRLDRDGFRIGGRVVGPGGAYGAWLSGGLRARGLTLGGGVETPRRFWDFKLDTDLDTRTGPTEPWPQRL